jgi:periplasmic divalent cation tolerance protein
MKTTREHRVVLVTAPNRTVARRLVRRALETRVAACGNIVPGLESHYWWQGKLEKSAEVLVLFKTTAAKAAGLESLIRENHPYDTPEYLVLPIEAGSERYLDWIEVSVREA